MTRVLEEFKFTIPLTVNEGCVTASLKINLDMFPVLYYLPIELG